MPFPLLWRTVSDKGNRIGYNLISCPQKDFNHQEALSHKQLVTCSIHNSLGIISGSHCKIPHMWSGTGHRSWPPEYSPNSDWLQCEYYSKWWLTVVKLVFAGDFIYYCLISARLFYVCYYKSDGKTPCIICKICGIVAKLAWHKGQKQFLSLSLWHQAVMSGQTKWRQGQLCAKPRPSSTGLATWQI